MNTNPSVKVTFNTEEDATNTLAYLRQAIRQYGRVTYAALLDLIDAMPIYDDTMHGWSRLEDDVVSITQADDDQHILVLPPMEDFIEVEPAPERRHLTKKHLAIIAGTVIGLGVVTYVVNRTELGFNLKKKCIRHLMASQIVKNNRCFIQYYTGDKTSVPKEAVMKIGDAIDEILKSYNIETHNI